MNISLIKILILLIVIAPFLCDSTKAQDYSPISVILSQPRPQAKKMSEFMGYYGPVKSVYLTIVEDNINVNVTPLLVGSYNKPPFATSYNFAKDGRGCSAVVLSNGIKVEESEFSFYEPADKPNTLTGNQRNSSSQSGVQLFAIKDQSALVIYDEQNRISERIVSDEFNKGRLFGRFVYSYSVDNLSADVVQYDKEGKVIANGKIVFDEKGNLLSSQLLNLNGQIVVSVSYEYKKFDKQGNWIKAIRETTYFEKGKQKRKVTNFIDREIEYYKEG